MLADPHRRKEKHLGHGDAEGPEVRARRDRSEESSSHAPHVERTHRKPWFSLVRGRGYAKKADLEANVIHYVSQYAKIVNELLRVPRVRDGDVDAKVKVLSGAFKKCIRANVDRALSDASDACCLEVREHFFENEELKHAFTWACAALSRRLLASLKELKAFLQREHGHESGDEHFQTFTERHLSNKELGVMFLLYEKYAWRIAILAAVQLLFLASQAGLFGPVAAMLHLPASVASQVQTVLGGVGGVGGLAGPHSAVFSILAAAWGTIRMSLSGVLGVAAAMGLSTAAIEAFAISRAAPLDRLPVKDVA